MAQRSKGGGGEHETSTRQKRVVDNMLSGDYPSKAKAIKAAGYSDAMAHKPARVINSSGVQKYVKKLDKKSRELFGVSIGDKIVEVYTEGMGATKLFGKNAIEHPDWLARKAFADKIGPMIGLGTGPPEGGGKGNQYNFFMFNQQEKSEFNSAFGKFVKGHFKQPRT